MGSLYSVNSHSVSHARRVLLSFLVLPASVAVMSVDLGSEWMKIAIVKPGVPMEIALNRSVARVQQWYGNPGSLPGCCFAYSRVYPTQLYLLSLLNWQDLVRYAVAIYYCRFCTLSALMIAEI